MKNLYLLVFVFLFAACSQDDISIVEFDIDLSTQSVLSEPQFEQGFVRLLVAGDLADDMEKIARSGQQRADALPSKLVEEEVNIRSIKRTFPHAGRFEERSRKAGLHLWYDVEFDSGMTVAEFSHKLSTVSGVRQVESRPVVARYWDDKVLEYVHETTTRVAQSSSALPFNDPQLSNQWHYHNDGSLGAKYKAGADINLPGAWDYTTGSPDVVVAIIDGGVDYLHEDLAANMWVNMAEKNGTASVDDDNNGYKDDLHGYNFISDVGKLVPHDHGTHVAGTVAAVTNNGKGVSGIAGGNGQPSSGVRVMSCQIFVNDDDPYASNAGRKGAAAIKYAADNGAVICQNSWGYPTLTETPGSDRAAIDYFIQYAGIDESGRQTGAMRGGIVIFAAGNENREGSAPASYDKVLAVSSIAPDYRRAYYSNFGQWVDLSAPGGDVQSFGNKGSVLSTVVGDKYGYMQGTSMACPHVSGVAALVLSHFKRSGYNADMLRARLENSAKNIDSYNSSYAKRLGNLVDAKAAMAGGSTIAPDPVGSVTSSVRSNVVKLQWNVPADADDVKASGFNVYYRKAPLTGINASNPPADVKIHSFPTGNLSVGSAMEVEIDGLDFESLYYFAVNAFDFSGNFSSLSQQITQTTLTNNPPVLTIVDSVSVIIRAHQTAVLKFKAIDPDGHAFWWALDKSMDGVTLNDLGNGTAQITIEGVESAVGQHSFNLILEDEYGLKVSQVIQFEVLKNHAPELVSQIEDIYMGGLNKENSFAISDYFKDIDGELLRYSFQNTAPGVVNVNENKGKLYVVSLAYGLAEISMTATDAMGLSVTQQFSVLVRDDKQLIDVYPNPVKDFVWLRTAHDRRATVIMYNSAGAKVFENDLEIKPFSPAKIDMSKFSGGVYSLHFKFSDQEIKQQLIKL